MRKVERILNESPQYIIDKAWKGQYSIHKAFKHLEYEQERQRLINTKPAIDLPDNIRLIHGEFQEKGNEIPDNSIDLIFTDPPYDEGSLPLYRDLGILGTRVLKPGGSLVLLGGAYSLIRSANLIEESGLKYTHTIAVIHSGACGMDLP